MAECPMRVSDDAHQCTPDASDPDACHRDWGPIDLRLSVFQRAGIGHLARLGRRTVSRLSTSGAVERAAQRVRRGPHTRSSRYKNGHSTLATQRESGSDAPTFVPNRTLYRRMPRFRVAGPPGVLVAYGSADLLGQIGVTTARGRHLWAHRQKHEACWSRGLPGRCVAIPTVCAGGLVMEDQRWGSRPVPQRD